MRITHIELTDWGPHRHIDADTDSGILGVVGSNGSGKSNLLQAIDYAFTGNLNGRTGASYIRGFGTNGGAKKATVRIVFQKNGMEGEITREVGQKTSKRCLKWDGCTYSKSDEVEKVLNNILGVDKAALANAAFIKQGDIAGIVQGTPAERNDIFRKLVRLWFIDKRSDDLLARQSALESSVKDYSEVKSIIENKIADAKDALVQLNQAVADSEWADSMLPKARAYDKAMCDVCRASDALKDANSRLARARESIASFGHNLDEQLHITPDKLQECKDKCDEDIEFINGMLGRAVEMSELGGVVSSSEKALDGYMSQLADLCSNACDDEAALQGDLGAARSESSALESLLGACKACAAAEDGVRRAEEAWNAAKDACRDTAAFAGEAAELRSAAVKAAWRCKMYETKLAVLRDPGMQAKCPCCGRDVELSPDDTEDSLSAAVAEEKAAADDANRMAKELEEAAKAAGAAEIKAAAEYDRAVSERNSATDSMLVASTDSSKYIGVDLPVDGAKAVAVVEPALDSALERATALESRLESARKTARDIAALEAKVEACESEISKAKSRIADISGEEDTGTLDKDMWTDELDKAMKLSIKLHAVIVEKDSLDKAAADAAAAVGDAEKRMQEANDTVNACWTQICSEVEARGLSNNSAELVESVESAMETLIGCRAKADTTRESISSLEEEYTGIMDKIERNNRRVTLVDDLKKVRSIIGKNGVPLAYMNTVFKGIAALVRDMLPKMGANFSVEPDTGSFMSFTFCRTDDDSGHRMAQEQLSGGQAVRLALALLIACQQVVLPDLGLLVLDEPSSHIDDDGISSMRDMFADLAGVMDSADMQLIIVDHNVNLMSAFGRTIKLSGNKQETA